MKCNSRYLFFETVANRTRMGIIESLFHGPKSVNQICQEVGEEQSTVSHSLSRLKLCKILDVKKEGKKRVYSLNQDTVLPILNLVDKHVNRFCKKECLVKSR